MHDRVGQAGRLTRAHFTVLGLTSLGGALELFDFVIFVYFVPALALLFFPPDIPHWLAQLQTFTVFAVGYFARPLGGVLIAHFGDRIGRKRTFGFTLTLMAAATFAIGLLPTYAAIGGAAPALLSLLRLVQGLAIGGELPGGYLFGAEHLPPTRRGFACGLCACAMNCGLLAGSLLAAGVHMAFTEPDILAFGWRIPFLVGGALGFIAVGMRRQLQETPVFLALAAEHALSRGIPILEILRNHGRAVAVSVAAFWVFAGHFMVLSLMTPTLLQTLYGETPVRALLAGALAVMGCVLATPFSGHLFDRLGPGTALLICAPVALVLDAAFFLTAPNWPALHLPLLGLAGVGWGLCGGASLVMMRAFPPRVAYTGVALSMNIVAGFLGGLTPILISAAVPVFPQAPLLYLAGVSMLGAITGAALLRDKRAQHS